jgi:hypothetical protein
MESTVKRIVSALAAAAMLAVGLTIAQPSWAVPPTPSFPAAIDPYASDVTPGCDPTAKPGVVAFRGILKAEYGRPDAGIVRDCDVGGPSDHHEGRALDYPFDATDSAQKADADALLAWLLATDQYGNKDALARRLGINYIIWNKRMWRAYNPSAGWQPYTKPGGDPHTSHIHFSFGWPGARKQTSWWTSGGVDRVAESTNGDQYDDLLAVDPNNVMQVYHGTANGTFAGAKALGGGWSSYYNRIAVGDSNADGSADILATSTDGRLHYWHNSGTESFTKLANAGVGWNSIEWFSVADINGDDKADILARDGGILYWYPGQGSGDFGSRIQIGEGWGSYPKFAAADADGDGDADIWATDASGDLYFWEGTGRGTFAVRVQVGSGWSGFAPFNAMDVNGDGKADLVAVRTSDGDLFRWSGKGDGTFNGSANIGHGWNDFRPATY